MERGDYQTTSAAADAIIRINLRDSREKAILSLYELQPTSISRKILAALFDNDATLSTQTLLSGVGHRNAEVRRIVVELLCNRRALPIGISDQLLTDSDAKVRYEALKSLVHNGRTFSDVEAKKILIKQAPNTLLGLLHGGASGVEGETCWSHFQLGRLRLLEDKALENASITDLIIDPDSHFVLAERQFKHDGEDLRKSVDDQYKEKFSQALHALTTQFGERADLLEKIRSREDIYRKEFTRKGLNVICRKAKACDLGRVRLAFKSGFIDYSATDVEYLRRFGEWEDIPLIIASTGRPESGHDNSLLSASDEFKYQTAARAIYALGRTRLSEILTMSAPSRLLSQLIVEISDKAFRTLSDVSVSLLLRSEDDGIRRTAALKCVRALPKRRITELFNDYKSGEQHRYYNVVHWLDFGVSAPRDRALPAAEKALNKE